MRVYVSHLYFLWCSIVTPPPAVGACYVRHLWKVRMFVIKTPVGCFILGIVLLIFIVITGNPKRTCWIYGWLKNKRSNWGILRFEEQNTPEIFIETQIVWKTTRNTDFATMILGFHKNILEGEPELTCFHTYHLISEPRVEIHQRYQTLLKKIQPKKHIQKNIHVF